MGDAPLYYPPPAAAPIAASEFPRYRHEIRSWHRQRRGELLTVLGSAAEALLAQARQAGRLDIADGPGSAAPWELLAFEEPGHDPAFQIRHVVPPDPGATTSPPYSSPLRLLSAWALPEGSVPLNLDAQQRRLREALRPVEADALCRYEGALSSTELHLLLLQFRPHILCFNGHTRETELGESLLQLHDAPLSGAELRAMIRSGGDYLRLLFLGVCFGDAARTDRPSLARAALRAGVPRAIGFATPAVDQEMPLLSGKLFSALARGEAIEETVHRLREQLQATSLPPGSLTALTLRLLSHPEPASANEPPPEPSATANKASIAAARLLFPPEQRVEMVAALHIAEAMRELGADALYAALEDAAGEVETLLAKQRGERRVGALEELRALGLVGHRTASMNLGTRPLQLRPGPGRHFRGDPMQLSQEGQTALLEFYRENKRYLSAKASERPVPSPLEAGTYLIRALPPAGRALQWEASFHEPTELPLLYQAAIRLGTAQERATDRPLLFGAGFYDALLQPRTTRQRLIARQALLRQQAWPLVNSRLKQHIERALEVVEADLLHHHP